MKRNGVRRIIAEAPELFGPGPEWILSGLAERQQDRLADTGRGSRAPTKKARLAGKADAETLITPPTNVFEPSAVEVASRARLPVRSQRKCAVRLSSFRAYPLRQVNAYDVSNTLFKRALLRFKEGYSYPVPTTTNR